MSYDRRGGGGRRRNFREEPREELPVSPEERIKESVVKFGEVDALQEVPRLIQQIRDIFPPPTSGVAEGFRISVTEQPFKTPYFVLLLHALHLPVTHASDEDAPIQTLGPQVLDDIWKGFQGWLDQLAWREVRLCVHFFAHLTVAKLVSTTSMLALLQSFVAVLEEFGVSHGRAKRAALCVAEGLMRAGQPLKRHHQTEVSEMIASLQTYVDTTASMKPLVQPITYLASQRDAIENGDELLDTAIASLRSLDQNDFVGTADAYLQPYLDADPLSEDFAPFDLPTVLVPPEIIELDNSGEEADAPVEKKEEWPEYYLRLFDDDITPDPTTPAGYAVRSTLLDVIDIFEVNRKECARVLLELPKWFPPGTFKPLPGAPVIQDPVPGKDWQLESCVMEATLANLVLLPEPKHKPLYHISLIVELAKLSPSTVGPAVGKSIRKLYSFLSDGLDVEVARRCTEWFAVHMSNFNFTWVWKEWVPDLDLALQHPKRSFMRRSLDREIRLAYYDRIMKTLPPLMQEPEGHCMPDQAPGPNYFYEDSGTPHYDAAQGLLSLMAGRNKADEVVKHLDYLRNAVAETEDSQSSVDSTVRFIVVQSLLQVGSRSFSHFLNAVERYLPVLRHVSSPNNDASRSGEEIRRDVLRAVASFWKYNTQMVGVVLDKFMQYQIVDPSDIVTWALSSPPGTSDAVYVDAAKWDLVEAALDKANGRVVASRKKVATIRKEDDDARARVKAGDMEVDVEGNRQEEEEAPVVDSPALTNALKVFGNLTKEQRTVLSSTLQGFARCLKGKGTVISETQWHNRANWDDPEWCTWETWGWYRHFCRAYSPYLRNYSTSLSMVAFETLDDSDEASALIKKIWNTALGQE